MITRKLFTITIVKRAIFFRIFQSHNKKTSQKTNNNLGNHHVDDYNFGNFILYSLYFL